MGKVAGDQTGACQQELNEFKDMAQMYGHAVSEESAADDVYSKQLQDIMEGDMRRLLDDIADLSVSQSERSAVYAEYDANEAAADAFRQDLLKHLAGRIVVKEHKLRYQKEQFDRFLASLQYWDLKNKGMTLKEFSEAYSRLMKAQTDSSHNFRCHKIDANYDDFGEQTIRPLNATIFFYFFSANRSGKTWAQWMLSSVRYPNDRMRRAYMRFFA